MVNVSEGHENIPRDGGGRIYTLSTLRFIPKGDEVPKVLIHLLSHIFRRHASRLQASSITMTDTSDSMCSAVEMCCHRRFFSPPMCDIVSVTIDSHMEWLTHLAYILKATPPTCN